MDFTKILDAIDIIVNQKLSEAAFTRFINGTVIEIVNSEQNTYKVTTDGGKSNFIAQAVAADIDGGIVYEKDDEVKLLQLNGSNNSNENIYILGHSADFTKQDLNEIKSYFIKSESVTLTLNDNVFIMEEQSYQKLFDDIKQKCSFGLSANVKTPFGLDGLPLADYGFEIQFLDTADQILLKYKLNVNNMVGEPYKFTNFVPQKIERYITNPTIVNQIKKIKILINGLQSSEYNSLELYSAIWTQDTNDYQVTFKNPTRVDYITDKENDKTKFSLQAILLKNNKTFATNTCKYLWFKKNMSVTQGGDGYSFYGGEGWELLNEVEDITYLDINQIERTDRVIKNNIGNTYIIDKDKATMYHNYYKCVVLYNDLKIESETKHILNIDAAGDVNLRLGQTTGEATAAQVIEPNETISTFTEDGFYLGFVFNAVADISKYRVTIVRKTDQDDNETTYIFSTNPNTEKGEKQIYNFDGKYYGTIKQDYSDSYAAYMYVCSVANEVEENKFTLLESVEKSYYVEGGEVREIIQYYDNGTSAVMPTKYTESDWVDNYKDIKGWKSKYIIGRKKLSNVVNAKWEYFWFMVLGSEQSAAQLEEFNKLTKNGENSGLYYGAGYVKTTDTTPDEDKLYYIYDSDQSKYVLQENLKDFDTSVTYYEYSVDKSLYINADYINTGTLRVGNGENTKFFADVKNEDVQIGGFKVDNTSFTGGTPKSFKLVDDYCNNFSKGDNSTITEGSDENGDYYFVVSLYVNKNFVCYNQKGELQSFFSSESQLQDFKIYYINNDDSFGEEITEDETLPTNIKLLKINKTDRTSFTYNIQSSSSKDNNYQYFRLVLGDYYSDDYVYLGQNGLELGRVFSVSTNGNLNSMQGALGNVSITSEGLKLGEDGKISLGIDSELKGDGLKSQTTYTISGGNEASQLIFSPVDYNFYYSVTGFWLHIYRSSWFWDGEPSGLIRFNLSLETGGATKWFLPKNSQNYAYRPRVKVDIEGKAEIMYIRQDGTGRFLDTDLVASGDDYLEFPQTGYSNALANLSFKSTQPAWDKDGIFSKFKITITFKHKLNKNDSDSNSDLLPVKVFSNGIPEKEENENTNEFVYYFVDDKGYYNLVISSPEENHFRDEYITSRWNANGYSGYRYWRPSNKEDILTYVAGAKPTTDIKCNANFYPSKDLTYTLGRSSNRWNDIYGKNSQINTSDRSQKKDIQLLPTEYDLLYDKLEPVRYKFIQNESDRYHVGFISQDVEEALKLANLTSKDFAGFVKTKKEDSEDEFDYGLRYGEFIALNTDQIQKLKKRVLLLEQEIKEIKGEDNNETL